MREIGIVTETDGEYAVVKVDKKDECKSCGMCLFPKGASSIDFRAENRLGAKTGERVLIDTEKDGKLLGATLAFLIPLILIGLSAVISFLVIKSEIWMLILSVLFVVLWYTILAVIDKKLKKSTNFCPKIVEILYNGEDDL